jgi:hypothetical protein
VPVYVFGFSHDPVRLPTGERAFACDRDAARAVAALVADRPGAVLAQTDFQRLKYFADDSYVLDLTGLNDRAIAHRRVDGPVQWGKIDLVDAANNRRPEIMILGHHTAPNARAMGRFPLAQVLADPSLHFDFWGYGLDGPSTQAVGAAYESASLPVCGGWFNFLVRKDLVGALRTRGATVAGGN